MMIRTLRLIRWASIAGIAILLLGIAVLKFAPNLRHFNEPASEKTASTASGDAVTVPAGVPIGGPFTLRSDKNVTVTDADYRGRWMLVFFGYTNCPDECPLTLQKMATSLKDVGPLADRIAPLFITVDPARDTPDRLASYLENFDTRIVGLTGSDEQIAAVAKAYRVYYAPGQNEQSGTDLVSHSTFLYLMNPGGKLNALFSQDVTADKLAKALRSRLAAEHSASN
ncbi:electron transport protein SCO1/SenC [Afipia sp. 1NLS2]|nr:electron transport protein SCO1/SenC [Afipia sp. 1NLS2]